MGRLLLICRLAARDLRHRPVQAVLLLLAIAAATATLTMGLALNGVTSSPYLHTKAATRGPDIVAIATPAQAARLVAAAGVTAHSGPYPLAAATLVAHGRTVPVQAEGRDEAPAAVDQPALAEGAWVRPGGVVLERTFADALGVGVGDPVRLNGRSFRVAGIAVTAAVPEYPGVCYYLTCNADAQAEESGMGMVWLTQADARDLATRRQPLSSVLNLRLANPASAPSFADAYGPASPSGSPSAAAPQLMSWQQVSYADNDLVSVAQQVLTPGAWLAATLVPAFRAARVSTVRALASAARPPRRHALLIKIAAWLPVPLLIGLRLIARRPRRAALNAASTAVTVMGVVAVIAARHAATVETGRFDWFAGLNDPVTGRVNQVMAVLTVVLITLAAVNAIVTGWATALDARQPSALSRALGGSPRQVTVGLAAAQALSALPGALIGIPLGIVLFIVANGTGTVSIPPAPWLAAVVLGALVAVGTLTAIPAGLGARQPVAPILQSEAA